MKPHALRALLLAGGLFATPTHAQTFPDTLDGAPYGALAREGVTVRFAPRDSRVAERVLDFLVGQTPLPGLGPGVPDTVVAVLAHTPEAFDQITGGAVPEWRAGVAIPALRLLVVPTGEGTRILDGDGRRTLRHEWAHLGLHEAVGGLRAPRWFNEGYAQWASGGFDAGEAWRLRVLLALGRAPPLDSLTLSWPRDGASAGAAYLLSASAVTYLLGESGERGLALLVDRWRESRSFETAFRTTFGVTTGQFEEDWRRHVRSRYGWLFVLSHSLVFWMLLALVLLLMLRIRQRYDRDRLARLRADEVPDRPAFWDGEGTEGPEGPEGPDNPAPGVVKGP